MNDIDTLAHIIAGEALSCPFAAMVLIGYLWGLDINRTFYGWDTPDTAALLAASYWWMFDHPAPGAKYLFGTGDLHKPAVRRIIGRDPPLRVFECDGGLSLYAYG